MFVHVSRQSKRGNKSVCFGDDYLIVYDFIKHG